jgi:hypothetical protein
LPALNQTVVLKGEQQRAIRNSVHSGYSGCAQSGARPRTLYTIDPQGLIESPTQLASLHQDASGSTNSLSVGEIQLKGVGLLAARTGKGRKSFCMRNHVANEFGASIADGTAYYTMA